MPWRRCGRGTFGQSRPPPDRSTVVNGNVYGVVNCVKGPFARYAVELADAVVTEDDAGPGNEVPDRAGHERLAGVGDRRDPSRDVNCQAADIVADDAAFPGVDTGAEFESQSGDPRPDRADAGDGSAGRHEGAERSLSGS